MDKKVFTITFHASYNYGSCLQAFALQEYVKNICNGQYEYNIINLRTETQKSMYKNIWEKNDIKSRVKRMVLLSQKKDIIQKSQRFEDFIQKRLSLTKEYSSLEELKRETWPDAYYIAGSDQLWNLVASDFDWANYLEFTDSGKKISYAASFGPNVQSWSNEERERIKKDLEHFNYLSVREEKSFKNVKELAGIEAEMHIDPTMLLTKLQWEEIINEEKLYQGDYIFLYNIRSQEYIKLAKKISDEMKLPVVISTYCNKLELIYGFKKRYQCGPVEFLNLIKNAKLVLSSSFHGTVFSILLNKPFFALKGESDFRINTLLKKMNLEDRNIEFDDYKEKCKNAYEIDFSESEEILKKERKKSEEYLKKALDIK